MIRYACALTLLLCTAIAVADEQKARINYMINCQGCHLADASGAAGKVPNMNGYVGNFLRVTGGREFLVQVPGSANSPLSDSELAELLNWLLLEFSADQLPDDFRAYSAAEVALLRKSPLSDVQAVRDRLVAKIEDGG